ncbi:hypothetical protein P4S63_24405 [Pseudoalteromonas sp. B193]
MKIIKIFAILVTNYFADKLLEDLTVESPQGTQVYLMNNEGEFLYHPNPQLRFRFEFNKTKTWSEEFSTATTMTEQGTLPISNYPVAYTLKKRISIEGDITMLPLELGVSVDTKTLFAKVNERRQNFIAMLVVFFSIFLVIAFYTNAL